MAVKVNPDLTTPVAERILTLIPNGENLYVTQRNNEIDDIFQVGPNKKLTKIGGPGKQFAAHGPLLYGLSPKGTQIWKFSSALQWDLVFTATNPPTIKQILIANRKLYAELSDNNIYSIDTTKTPSTQTMIGGPASLFLTNLISLYGVAPDKSVVNRYLPGTGWRAVISPPQNDPVDVAYASGSSVAAVGEETGIIYFFNDLIQVLTEIPPNPDVDTNQAYEIYSAGVFALPPTRRTIQHATTISRDWGILIPGLSQSIGLIVSSGTFGSEGTKSVTGSNLYGFGTNQDLYLLATYSFAS